jgi:hypothetical protein
MWPILLMVACGPKHEPRQAADIELHQAWERQQSLALQARFNITIRGPDDEISTQGAMVLFAPDKIRLDVQTPLITPMFLLASDGSSLDIWLHRDGVFLQGSDALVVLEQITEGAIALEDVLVLMTGGLPLEGAEVSTVEWLDDEVHVRVQSSRQIYADVWLQPETDTVRLFEVRRDGTGEDELIFRVELGDLMGVGRQELPEEMKIELPSIGWGVELEIRTWDELGVIPDIFTLAPPPGAQVHDLVETVRSLAESQGVHPLE